MDVSDCLNAIHNDELGEMSEYEVRGFLRFVKLCKDVAEEFDHLSEEELEDFINQQQED
jgi:hypothetical protein